MTRSGAAYIPSMSEPKVEYNFLGKCGVKVSNLCLGTMMFGQNEKWPLNNPRQANEELSHQIMDLYASYGGNFLDTANTYMGGTSEEVVGRWLAKNDRKRYVVATKVGFEMHSTDENGIGLSRRHIIESLEESLERMQLNYIDLFQSHRWDGGTHLDETLRTFDDLIRCGKIRYYGASNVCGWQMQKIVDRIEAMGLNSCVSLQQQYNLLARQSEFEEFMVCHNEGIAVLPWCPLKGGLLTGKYKRDVATLDPSETRLGVGQAMNLNMQVVPSWSEFVDNEGYWKLMDVLTEIATSRGKSIPQVAIRWLLQKDVVTSVIIGATCVEQLKDNMGAATGWTLSDVEMKRLDETSVQPKLYPGGMIWKSNAGSCNPRFGAYIP